MNTSSIIAPLADRLPASLGDEVQTALAVILLILGAALAVAMILSLAGMLRRTVTKAPATSAASEAAGAPASSMAAPDLDPEEWVAGNVIYIDRYKAVGFIRCARVKSPVRFEVPAVKGVSRPPRVGESVRFKGRHGARRRPVALIVEPNPQRRAG